MAEWVQILQLSTKYIDLGLNLQFIRGFFVNCALFFLLGADRIMVQSKEGSKLVVLQIRSQLRMSAFKNESAQP